VEKAGDNAVAVDIIKRLTLPIMPNNTIIPFADIVKLLENIWSYN
jgi:hypothetical protein